MPMPPRGQSSIWPLSVSPLADSSFLSPFYPPYCLSLFISTLTKSPDLSILSIIPQSPPSCLPNCSHCICSIKYFEALLYTNLSFIILYMNFHQLFSLLVLLWKYILHLPLIPVLQTVLMSFLDYGSGTHAACCTHCGSWPIDSQTDTLLKSI